ncbi:MAG: hypothetical protein R2798_09515 [Chitinophagales bacterium]|nr:hypothetical protein [Bacteroidota bacterium]
MSRIRSDKFSEEYRKYIISIKFNKVKHYTLWWTSMQDDNDYILVSDLNQILYGSSIVALKNYLKDNIKRLPDSENLNLWLEKHSYIRSYTTYDFDLILTLLKKQNFSLANCTKPEICDLLDFRNLFSDYVIQINSQKYLKILDNKVQHIFFDFACAHCLWSNDFENRILLNDFNNVKFKKEFLGNIDFFSDNLVQVK